MKYKHDQKFFTLGVKIFKSKYFAIESLEFSHPYASLQVETFSIQSILL